MGLRELTSDLHRKAEKMPFNQKMFNGELTKEEYLNYLHQQYYIFEELEKKELPHTSLNRFENVKSDIIELGGFVFGKNESTNSYIEHLSKLEDTTPHIYLNYFALLFGGQMMKSKIHGSGKMYDFENVNECIMSIRKIQKDEWSDEVNNGFEFIINILDELQKNT